MSADNAVVILETKDEYRVGHFQAIDNLYWIWGDPSNQLIVPIRVFEFFHDIEPINRKDSDCQNKVLNLANVLYEKIGYLEYGIITISLQNTFKEIALQAMWQADEERCAIAKDRNITDENRIVFSEEVLSTMEDIIQWNAENQ